MPSSLTLVLDAIIYEIQAHGGLSSIYSEILPRMCEIDPTLSIQLITSGRLKRLLPVHSRIFRLSIYGYLRPWHLWKPVVQQAWSLVGKRKIWHSTYYTVPKAWRGWQVVTVADMIYEQFPKLFAQPADERLRKQKKLCIEQAAAIICISRTTAADVSNTYQVDSRKIHVVYLAHSDTFRTLEHEHGGSATPSSQPFLLYVGGRYHYKNFDTLLSAFSKWARRQEIELVVVGKDWTRTERQLLQSLNIEDRVKLLTSVNDEQLCRLYNRALALVYPSLCEGFGIPLVEAMACGCPVIASRIPSSMEVAGDCPIYFEPLDEGDLLNAFERALVEGPNSTRVSSGRDWVNRYSWSNTARQILNIYHGLSEGKL